MITCYKYPAAGTLYRPTFFDYSNALLIFIPLSWTFHYVKLSNTLAFVFSILAIVPLTKLHALATDELSLHFGQTFALLFNATLGNAHSVGLIIAIIALRQIAVVMWLRMSSCRFVGHTSRPQTFLPMIGSILCDSFLVPAMSFFAGGIRFVKQRFDNINAAQQVSLLISSVISLLLPTAFFYVVQHTDAVDLLINQHDMLLISHLVSVALLFIYLYLVSQFFSRKNSYDDHLGARQSVPLTSNVAESLHISEPNTPVSSSRRPSDGVMGLGKWDAGLLEADEEKIEKPAMGLQTTIILLVVITVLVCFTAKVLVDSIDELTSSGHIPKNFVGLILLPLAGTAAEHITAVTHSINDNITRSLEVAVGSSIQIALFAIPFVVIIGWILSKPLTLLFDPLVSMVLVLLCFNVKFATLNGNSNWLTGITLMSLYVTMMFIFWIVPELHPAEFLSCK